jgi:hypothetical protein
LATANEIIARSLRLINVLGSGEQPTGPEAQDALVTLNQMLDSWSTQRMEIFTVQRLGPFPLISGQQAYTVGPGGDINIPRPPYIQRYGILDIDNPAQPLELPLEPLTAEEWAGIPVKNIQSALPLKVFDDRGFPYRTLYFWCVPNVQVQFVIYAWIALTAFPDLNTDIEFPPGYAKAIAFNLAVDLAPEYGSEPSQVVLSQAASSLAAIQSINPQDLVLRCDPAVTSPLQGIYNWITDNYGRSYRG